MPGAYEWLQEFIYIEVIPTLPVESGIEINRTGLSPLQSVTKKMAPILNQNT